VREGRERGKWGRTKKKEEEKKGNQRKSVLLVGGHVDIPTAADGKVTANTGGIEFRSIQTE
jgi:hypothetical protein